MSPYENLLTPSQLAEYLGVSTGTLAVWRTIKRYPIPYIKVGSRIRYNIDEVKAWLKSRTKDGGIHAQ